MGYDKQWKEETNKTLWTLNINNVLKKKRWWLLWDTYTGTRKHTHIHIHCERLPQALLLTRETKCIWKLFFLYLLLFKQIVNCWIPKPGCPLTLFMAQWSRLGKEIQNKEHLSHDLRWLQAYAAFSLSPPNPLFLFKPRVILWGAI